ncbi:uncharacterized protein LOC132951596 [Metopolophium dirhodum]|uniref:uncharacterized protein LOC132951596 n=1 Tax=Metopolophium dirhodum TaxID=44670 RepID=UPI0029906F63|nr:uncharacterized protein LOC132951596 [Metopolophium dirhodum]XP_060879362.1 uncharacterized protein LOC132951596 [Metopolophium dirhodum]
MCGPTWPLAIPSWFVFGARAARWPLVLCRSHHNASAPRSSSPDNLSIAVDVRHLPLLAHVGFHFVSAFPTSVGQQHGRIGQIRPARFAVLHQHTYKLAFLGQRSPLLLERPTEFYSATRRANPALGNGASDFPVRYAIKQLGVSTFNQFFTHGQPASSSPGHRRMTVRYCVNRVTMALR